MHVLMSLNHIIELQKRLVNVGERIEIYGVLAIYIFGSGGLIMFKPSSVFP